ncbi:GNAT family N-acetyltransferase [Prosthecobacter sp.]|uniref:GNAT family N-acetyltransferase n=1 Tax=Prosthecobacter sp. TaxID=1965333 RepID=UPI002AB9EF36|nr:GNAT family N-acetyltransferase [Prosthecobacter sp.]MDZ4404902.1 GNAT family N-acetyltransferase [Prosthecobacter sp.]
MLIRQMTIGDYLQATELWQQASGVEVAEGDDFETLRGFLSRRHHSFVAVDKGEAIIGAVLCGDDGRRGYLYHLAVAAAHQRRGIGTVLVQHCLAALRGTGILRATILVELTNSAARAFWSSRGFEEISLALPMGVDL